MYIYRAVLTVIVAAVSIFHTTPGFSSLFISYAFTFIPLIVCLGLFERELPGALFGALAGVIYDISSPLPDGFNAIFLTIMGFICGLLVHYVLRNNLISALLLCLFFTLLYSLSRYLLLKGCHDGALEILKPFLITMLVLPVYYLLIRYISKQFKTSDDLDKI